MADNFISTDTPVDLTNCDREPIHILGHVQSFGALIAISADWIVQHASENVDKLLGLRADDLIGLPLSDGLPRDTMQRLSAMIGTVTQENSVVRAFGVDLLGDGRRFDVASHMTQNSFIFEFEPGERAAGHDEMSLVSAMLRKVSNQSDTQSVAQAAAEQLRGLTGFDRVMVYRFGAEGDGTVIAEARDEADSESYLGLHFPASDIPRQARELYKRNLIRLIMDVDDTVSPIVPQLSPEGMPLDLSMSISRAVSPIHLEYLRNMNVRGSMSVSILQKGELWGLFACHHRQPIHIDYQRRTAVELLAQFFAYEIERQEARAVSDASGRAQRLHDRLMVRLSSGERLEQVFPTIAEEIAKVVDYDGIAVYSDGTYLTRGAVPTQAQFEGIARFLNTAAASRVYATDNLTARLPAMAGHADVAAGILAIPISRTPRDYIVLFRSEVVRQVKWAGNPEKPVELGPNGARLTPRKSFETWKQDVGNRSEQWSVTALRAAEAIRITLLEVVLKLSDEVNAERKRAQDQQELLIAELNHRVRNVLGLIRSLVSQSRRTATSMEDFTAAIDGRIHALAQAHDQLTRTDWTPVAFRDLLYKELDAYIASERDRVSVLGPRILLSPEAFSSIALVFHELVTNSVKYGALSVPAGRVTIEITPMPDGNTRLHWSETGGPAVRAPERRGFGTTIIERSIPFELKGTAETRFAVTGFEATFTIPERFITLMPDTPEPAAAAPAQALAPLSLSGVAMVVEDNMIIAMDAADILETLGVQTVHIAGSVAEALRVAEANTLSLAVLDVNLGAETSLPVAQVLAAQNVPFLLASGYGSNDGSLARYPQSTVIAKPFTLESLSKGLATLPLGPRRD